MHNLRHNIHNVYKSAAETLLPVRSSSAFKVKRSAPVEKKVKNQQKVKPSIR